MSNKKLIVIEGASDGVGKTTQFNLLKEYLETNNKVVTHHFPTYDSYQGELVTRYLNGEYGSPQELSPYFINSLYAIDRAVTWKNELEKFYNDENIILLDRYTTSSIIYQSAFIVDKEEKIKFIDYVNDYEYNKLGIAKPDKVIFLTASLELITDLRNKRKQETNDDGDIHENDVEFMKKVYDSALFCAKYLNWTIIECSENNKLKSVEEIHKEILKKL